MKNNYANYIIIYTNTHTVYIVIFILLSMICVACSSTDLMEKRTPPGQIIITAFPLLHIDSVPALASKLGGPVRVIVPGKYGYKNTMWLTEIQFTESQEDGYWEKRAYHQDANPFSEERVQSKDNVPSHQ